jgi:hypothetical protein
VSEELVQREVAAEQAFVGRVHAQLEKAGSAAQELAKEGHSRGRMGHEGGLVERDAMVFQAAKRIAQLDAAHEGLVFGRLDLTDDVDPEPRYVGRIGLRDDNRDVLLIDWRAPAAAVFYQATAADPHQVIRRRVQSGEPVILLHGYTDSWNSFALVLPLLPEPLLPVLGVDDPEYGQVLAAFYQGPADPDDIREACQDALASYKVPRRIERVDVNGLALGSARIDQRVICGLFQAG